MKWIFIVYWCICTHEPISSIQMKENEFGEIEYYNDLVYRYEEKLDCDHQKYFLERNDAIAFYKRAKERESAKLPTARFDENSDSLIIESYEYYGEGLRNIRLDSIKWEDAEDIMIFK